jgi:alpha-glucosidase
MRTRLTAAGLAAAALIWVAYPAAEGQSWEVASPDGRTAIAVSLDGSGRLVWRVAHDKAAVLADSPMGLRRHDQTFVEGLKLAEASDATAIDERYSMPHGKRHDHVVRGRERVLTFVNPQRAKLQVVLRAHDDGVAFRYRFPETDTTVRRVFEEYTGFHVADGSIGWMLPHQDVHKYGPAYEDLFQAVRVGEAAPRPAGWSFPALFKAPSGAWMLLTEAALDDGYVGSHLAAEVSGGVYRIKFPDPEEGLGVGEIHPLSALPWTMPWRVVMIGDAAGRLVESDLVNDLSPRSAIADTSWIKPGRAAWSWWSASDSPRHAEQLNAFTDFAAEMGWEYALVDANWDKMQTGRIEDVIAHAKEKGVGLLFWYNSGGPHNDVTEAPRDRMDLRDARRAELAKLRDWGVKGIKVDFWHSDKQDRIRQYRDILRDAAEFHLMVDFHGCTIPRGWSREFPNLVSMEAVFGAEQYKFRDFFPAKAAEHNSVLPFTRNAIGSMDYTPVTFSDVRYPHRTTNAHELALSIVFESGIQHFADSAASYRALPEAPRQFLRAVPAAWDETRALSGEPGRAVVIARRAGEVWYVGGVNGQDTPGSAQVGLSFLGSGAWTAQVIRDGADDRTCDAASRQVTAKDTIDVPVRARGGFVIRIAKGTGR